MGNAASIESRVDRETAKTLAGDKWAELEAKFDELAVDGFISKDDIMVYIPAESIAAPDAAGAVDATPASAVDVVPPNVVGNRCVVSS